MHTCCYCGSFCRRMQAFCVGVVLVCRMFHIASHQLAHMDCRPLFMHTSVLQAFLSSFLAPVIVVLLALHKPIHDCSILQHMLHEGGLS
jgi:hypothetical protein